MTGLREQVISVENLTWAWQKARRLYRMADGVVDFGEIAAFELDLENQLATIGRQLGRGSYRLNSLVLLPQPKKSDEHGNPRLRQSFHVSVRDQVAWIALVNVVGPRLDLEMPKWSYGHRLYKAAWYEELEDGHRYLELGPYRHTSGHLYRKFKHSWPLFRRHLSLTARSMVHSLPDIEMLDEAEQGAMRQADSPRYLEENEWPETESSSLYFASIDLEKFYPNIKQSGILRALERFWPNWSADTWLQKVVRSLLDFRVAQTPDLDNPIIEPITSAGRFTGVPTGLMVAGFLSNVAMLPIDKYVDEALVDNKHIAHFRFVDDHAFLARDFDALRRWIRDYEKALADLDIGPNIAPNKFEPPEMALAYKEEATADAIAACASASEIDGRNPAKLLTKTLALVSELAGADFDLLSEDSRAQRLHQLEWLLMTELPDTEIRSDTRTSFAAGKIASLIPVAYSPTIELLEAGRFAARIAKSQGADEKQKMRAKRDMLEIRNAERDKYRRQARHYFKMIFQAFRDHPDKPRLFIRALDYCRATGDSGTSFLLRWLLEGRETKNRPLANYLLPLALQTISRHAVTAVMDLSRPDILNRQRLAAGWYLEELSGVETSNLINQCVGVLDKSIAGQAAQAAVNVSIAFVSALSLEESKGVRRLKERIGCPDISAQSYQWKKLTGYSIGVWAHWLDAMALGSKLFCGPAWKLTIGAHDFSLMRDVQSARINAGELPVNKVASFQMIALPSLREDDAGWLLDQMKSEFSLQIPLATGRRSASAAIARYKSERIRRTNLISLTEWVAGINKIPEDHDPRRGEWTALEIIRKFLSEITTYPGLDVAILDELHPANVLIPSELLKSEPSEHSSFEHWTWEGWRHFITGQGVRVVVTKSKIKDYRRQPILASATTGEDYSWRRRLRGVGMLLLGLLSKDFRLPLHWNIRGMERDTAAFVKSTLEVLPVSSKTHAILEAALLPRSVESAIMRADPWAFLGIFEDVEEAKFNDTRSDPPIIADVESLLAHITDAQKTLEKSQISVLNHAPRQLVPMNILQLTGSAIELDEEEGQG